MVSLLRRPFVAVSTLARAMFIRPKATRTLTVEPDHRGFCLFRGRGDTGLTVDWWLVAIDLTLDATDDPHRAKDN